MQHGLHWNCAAVHCNFMGGVSAYLLDFHHTVVCKAGHWNFWCPILPLQPLQWVKASQTHRSLEKYILMV